MYSLRQAVAGFAALALATTASGKPLGSPELRSRMERISEMTKRMEQEIEPRQEDEDYYGLDTWEDKLEVRCTDAQWGTDGRANIELWYGTDALFILDDWIKLYSEPETGNGWFENLVSDTFPIENAMACSDHETPSCKVPDSRCEILFNGEKDYLNVYGAGYYWILKQVETFWAIMNKINKALVDESKMASALSIDAIVDEFGPPDYDGKGPNVWGLLGGAVTIAGGVFAKHPATAAVATVGAGIASIFIQTVPGAAPAREPGEDMKNYLHTKTLDFFTEYEQGISDLMDNALGTHDGDQRNLPKQMLTNHYFSKNPAAQFFDQGKWLYTPDDDEWTALEDTIASAAKAFNSQLIMYSMMKNGHYLMLWNERYGEWVDEAKCRERQEKFRVAVWMPNYNLCAELMSLPHGNGLGVGDYTNCDREDASEMTGCNEQPRRPPTAQIDSLLDNYGVVLADVYESAIACAENPTPVNPKDWTLGGMPHCFNQMVVKKGSWVQGRDMRDDDDFGPPWYAGYWDGLVDHYTPDYM